MRLLARQHLATLDSTARREESECLNRLISEWLDGQPDDRCVATFAALPDEPDLLPLHELRPGIRWVYPLVGDRGALAFHRVENPSELMTGQFGVREPDAARHPRVDIADIGLFLCPGVAFGPAGTRLGRGAGYYDRTLANAVPAAPRVGVHFSACVLEGIPSEPHDVRMTHLAGPASGIRAVSP